MKLNRKNDCCKLNGLEIVYLCDNCGTIVVEKDAGKHTVQCIDSVKAKKALECVEELVRFSRIKSAQWDIAHDDLDEILKKYGFM